MCKCQASSVAELLPRLALDTLSDTALSSEITKQIFLSLDEIFRSYPYVDLLWLNRIWNLDHSLLFAGMLRKVSPFYLHAPHFFLLNIQRPSIFEASLHPLSGCWKLDRKLTSFWGDIKVERGSVVTHASFAQKKLIVPLCKVKAALSGGAAAALAAS